MRVLLLLLVLCVALAMPRQRKTTFESRGDPGRSTGALARPAEPEEVGDTPANHHKRPRGDAGDEEAGSDGATRGRTKGKRGEHIARFNNPSRDAAVLGNQVLTEKRQGKRKAASGDDLGESLRSRTKRGRSRGKAAAASATATRGAAAAASACGHGGDDSGSDDEEATRLTAASATPTPAAPAKRQRQLTMQMQAAARRRAKEAEQAIRAQAGSSAQVGPALREMARDLTRQAGQQVSPAQMTL